ncbi:hypothetical protein [Acinetobacter calcoaceticus]|uniref:hypothetical protein n=1 Tax=Acinetobacter calcoaceticus TaxID=471 RepID=UPI001E343710|nr:hypothetical protein [Acinetobacter calcoaceticus]UGQ25301.1 hypothetical protein LRO55_13075 [Acinetobacter calcoaceticus]
MKNIYILTCSALLLIGCQTTSSMKNSITFVVGPSQHGLSFVFKNNWPLCGNFYDHNGNMPVKRQAKYLTHDNTCKIEPEGYVPEKIIIEYTPWLTYEEQVKAGMGNSRTAFNLDNIPLGKQPPLETLLAYDKQNEKKYN